MDPIIEAAALYKPVEGAVSTDFHIFASVYTALFSRVAGAADAIEGALSGTVTGWVIKAALLSLMIWAAAMALAMEGALFDKMLSKVLIPIVIVLYILQGHYHQYVSDPAISLVNEIGVALTGGFGGSVSGGAPFDALWNKAYVAGVKTYMAIPDSLLSPTGIGMAIIVGLYMLVAAGAIALAFILFICSQMLLYVLLALGPLFIAFGAIQFSRFLLKGFVSALASVMCAQVIVLTLLAMAFIVENTILTPVMDSPADSSKWGMIDNLIIVSVLLAGFTVLAFKSSAIAVGICGGIFDGIAPWLAAGAVGGRAVVSAGTSAIAGGRVAAPVIARSFSAAGRSLSGP